MTEIESLDAIKRMQAAFPAWAVWVNNKSPDPPRTLIEYGRLLKPLPANCVSQALDRMQAAEELPAYSRLVSLLRHEAQQIRSDEQAPTDEEIRRNRDTFMQQRDRRREEVTPRGSSRRAMARIAILWKESEAEFPGDPGGYYHSGNPTPRSQWVTEAAREVWREIDAENQGGTPYDGDEPNGPDDAAF